MGQGRTDLLGVFAGDKRVLVFTRNGMKWGNALNALLLHGMVPGYTEEDAHKLVVRGIVDDSTVPREVVKAPRRRNGTAPTNAWQRRRYFSLLDRVGANKDQYPLPNLAVAAEKAIQELRSLAEGVEDMRVGSDKQYGLIKIMEKALNIASGITRASRMTEMKAFISANMDAFRHREEIDRLRHDEFIALRREEVQWHQEELSEEEREAVADIQAFSAAGCSVVACAKGLLEVDESGLEIDAQTLQDLREFERSGRLPGVFWMGEDGAFEVVPVPDRYCRSLSGRTQHLLAAKRMQVGLEEYWASLDEMIARIMAGRRIKRSRARDIARRLLIRGWDATEFTLAEIREEDEEMIKNGIRIERREKHWFRLHPEDCHPLYAPDAEMKIRESNNMAPCDGDNGLPA